MFCPIVVLGPLISWSMAKTATSSIAQVRCGLPPFELPGRVLELYGFLQLRVSGRLGFPA